MQIKYEINPRIVRGLDYYNHTVFEIEAKVDGYRFKKDISSGSS